jgi:hypothetical protein
MQSWFRFYDDTISDPKVQLLSDNLFKFWINILCLANKNNGTLPDMHHLAYALHETEGSFRAFQGTSRSGPNREGQCNHLGTT